MHVTCYSTVLLNMFSSWLWNTSGNKWHKVTQSDINTNNIKGILTFVLIHLIKPKKQYTGKYKQLQQ